MEFARGSGPSVPVDSGSAVVVQQGREAAGAHRGRETAREPGMAGNHGAATRRQSCAETRRGQPRAASGEAGRLVVERRMRERSRAPRAGPKRSGARRAEVDFTFFRRAMHATVSRAKCPVFRTS
jgi:hypothetical protein